MSKIMYISQIKIENFRSIGSETFELKPFSILIGKNNAGKSNVMSAISLLLEGTPTSISKNDYREKDRDIIIEATVINVENYFELISDPKHKTRIENCLVEDHITIRRTASVGGKLSKLEILQPEDKKFGTPTGIDAAFRQFLPEVILIEAFADPGSQAQFKSSSTFGKIIKQIIEPIKSDVQDLLAKSFSEARKKLNAVYTEYDEIESDERFPKVKQMEELLRKNLKSFFLDSDVRLIIDPPSVDNIMGSANLELWDGGIWTPPSLKGQGFQRSLYVALLQTLAEQIRRDSEKTLKRPYFLMVEEPEIFLHPSLQSQMRAALEQISKANPIILATHSPAMVTPNTILNTILVRKETDLEGKATTKRLLPIFDAFPQKMDKRIRHLMQYQRSSAFLFSDCVAVVEGYSDIVLLEAIWEVLIGTTPDQDCVGFLDAESKATVRDCCKILSGIGLTAFGIVDLDFLWDGAGSCLKSDPDYSSFCEQFWNKATEIGITQEKNEQTTIIKGKKPKAYSLLKEHFEKNKKELCERLRENHKIWVLAQGEIEDYVGLTSSSKGRYSEAAREIRLRQREIEYQDEILELLKMIKMQT